MTGKEGSQFLCLRLRNYSRQLDFELIEANVNDGVLGVLFSEQKAMAAMGWYGYVWVKLRAPVKLDG